MKHNPKKEEKKKTKKKNTFWEMYFFSWLFLYLQKSG